MDDTIFNKLEDLLRESKECKIALKKAIDEFQKEEEEQYKLNLILLLEKRL